MLLPRLRFLLLLGGAVVQPALPAQTPPATFQLVHADPNEYSPSNWDALVDFVAQAGARNIRVSLEFGSTWVEAILNDATGTRLATVQAWALAGHAIGAHHHDYTHPYWDNYTDLEPDDDALPDGEPVLGTMASFYALQNQLAAAIGVGAPVCLFGGLDDSITHEFPYGLPYGTDGCRAIGCAVSQPYFRIVNNYGAWYVDHTYLGAGESVKLQDLINLHAATTAPNTFGFTLHVTDYATDPTLYTDWMDYLYSVDPTGQYNTTVPEILQPYGRPLEASQDFLPIGGGTVTLSLRTDSSLAGELVQFLVSLAGSEPGYLWGDPPYDDQIVIGLNPDTWTSWSMSAASDPWLPGFRGTLDAFGVATASIDTRGPLPTSWLGTRITVTAVVWDGSAVVFSANPVEIEVR